MQSHKNNSFQNTLHKTLFPAVAFFLVMTGIISTCVSHAGSGQQAELFDLKVREWAEECRADVTVQLELLVSSGKLTTGQLFDTFYIPVPNTSPQKYHTQYDALFDQVLQRILDNYLQKDGRLLYVVAVDRNGYVPTHNSKYNQPLTGNPEKDAAINRTKRIFNDRTGLEAARNREPFLIQKYSQDTGETAMDLSVPIMIHNQHWGAVRIGYKP